MLFLIFKIIVVFEVIELIIFTLSDLDIIQLPTRQRLLLAHRVSLILSAFWYRMPVSNCWHFSNRHAHWFLTHRLLAIIRIFNHQSLILSVAVISAPPVVSAPPIVAPSFPAPRPFLPPPGPVNTMPLYVCLFVLDVFNLLMFSTCDSVVLIALM